jgi:hypothetical protein
MLLSNPGNPLVAFCAMIHVVSSSSVGMLAVNLADEADSPLGVHVKVAKELMKPIIKLLEILFVR